MALSELPKGVFPIHHSDRGCQYCSHLYVEKLTARRLAVSMTEEMHCYENARAERLNGILKQEYCLGCSFRNKKQALTAIDEAVLLYNTKRPHLSLNYETPEKKIVVEVESYNEALLALDAEPDILQLDELKPAEIQKIAEAAARHGGRCLISAAGGIDKYNAAEYAAAGAQFIVSSAPYYAKPADVAALLNR
jgi:hypothetical protein